MDSETLLQRLAALHGHLCPRQVLGVRMGQHAAQLLALDLPQRDKRLFTVVETDGCFADGVSVATGCWLGHRTLRLLDEGKVAATFVDTQCGRAVRIWPRPAARTRAAEYAPDAESRWHAQLLGYQIMPADALLCAHDVTLSIDLAAIISRPGVRVSCAACGEEILNEREVKRAGEILCRSCSGERYYTGAEQRGIAPDPHLIPDVRRS